MNLPNKLVVCRLALVPVFLIFTVIDTVETRIFALVIFIVASLTDFYDGYFARKYGEITNFGKLMDPLADKFLISAALICFVGMNELRVPAWMVVLVIGREFLITGFRLLALTRGEVISADRLGKFKTTSQITAIVWILIVLCVNSYLHRYYFLEPQDLLNYSGWYYWSGNFLIWSSYWMVFIATIFTLLSGFQFYYRNRKLIAEESHS